MKKLTLTLLTCLIFLSPNVVLSETIDDLVERDGIFYKKFSQVPFTGKVTGEQKGSLKNGKREGAWLGYHSNGQLRVKGNYKNGEFDGAQVRYNRDGTVDNFFTGTFKNGKKISD